MLKDDTSSDDERWERLRSRQHLRYVIPPTGEEGEYDLSVDSQWIAFRSELMNECNGPNYLHPATATPETDGEVCNWWQDGVEWPHCEVYISLCIANILETIAGVTSEPMALGPAEDPFKRFPAQSTATNALLHEIAASEARRAAFMAIDCLSGAAGFGGGDPSCTAANMAQTWGRTGQELTFARSFSTALLEALQIADEATHNAVRDTLALSDGHYSSATTTADAATLGTSAPVMSRAHAAHLLIGGAEGLAGYLPAAQRDDPEAAFAAAFCTQPPLSARGQAALAVLRDAALDPAHVLSDMLTTESLLMNHVRPRLIDLYGLDGAALSSTSAADLAADLGLDVDAFREARAQMMEEHAAFARSSGEFYLPPREGASGSITDLFASTGPPRRQRFPNTTPQSLVTRALVPTAIRPFLRRTTPAAASPISTITYTRRSIGSHEMRAHSVPPYNRRFSIHSV